MAVCGGFLVAGSKPSSPHSTHDIVQTPAPADSPVVAAMTVPHPTIPDGLKTLYATGSGGNLSHGFTLVNRRNHLHSGEIVGAFEIKPAANL